MAGKGVTLVIIRVFNNIYIFHPYTLSLSFSATLTFVIPSIEDDRCKTIADCEIKSAVEKCCHSERKAQQRANESSGREILRRHSE